MKKTVFILLSVFLAMGSYAQTRAGDLTVGARGEYLSMYKSLTYGLDVSYQLTDPLEISFSGILNPNIKKKDDNPIYNRDVSLYSGNLDLRFYLINMEVFSTGPSIGGQCSLFKITDPSRDNYIADEGTAFGFNMGWHVRVELAEDIKLNGGWRYTTATENFSHHAFYLGIGYTFHLF
jgi:opacity protein-like surface antigen